MKNRWRANLSRDIEMFLDRERKHKMQSPVAFERQRNVRAESAWNLPCCPNLAIPPSPTRLDRIGPACILSALANRRRGS